MRTYVLAFRSLPTLAFDRVMDLIGGALDEIGNEPGIKLWATFFCPPLDNTLSDRSGSGSRR